MKTKIINAVITDLQHHIGPINTAMALTMVQEDIDELYQSRQDLLHKITRARKELKSIAKLIAKGKKHRNQIVKVLNRERTCA